MNTIRMYFDMVSYFIDADDNKYMSDTWNEEDVEEEVDEITEHMVIECAKSYAEQIADRIIVDEKQYDYLCEIMHSFNTIKDYEVPSKIEGLKLVKVMITNLSYEDVNVHGEIIDIDGEFIFNN